MFYRYGGSRGRQGRVCISTVSGLDLNKLSQKSGEPVARARFAVQNCQHVQKLVVDEVARKRMRP